MELDVSHRLSNWFELKNLRDNSSFSDYMSLGGIKGLCTLINSDTDHGIEASESDIQERL